MYFKKLNMKRRNFFIAILPILFGFLALQSCIEEDSATFTTAYAFTDPVVTAPLDGSSIKITGTTVDLKWATTNAGNSAIKCDVHFGLSEHPALYKAGYNALSLTVPVAKGATYYWYVVMIDANGITTTSPTWSFSVFEPIGIFVGNYTVDEPAEGWTYDVSFIKLSDNVLQIGNGAGSYDGYWASWTASFTLDFSKNTYSMPKTTFSGGYAGMESGTIDPATGKMVGNYTIWQTKAGVEAIIEEGVHTYTKK
jgi:hypothetical protein